ncbi:MAG: hypothetical protein WCD44_01880 [Candidatus Babeliales bacterium]
MEQKIIKIDETENDIAHDIENMHRILTKHPRYTGRATQKDLEDFNDSYHTQRIDFLIRKYAAHYAGSTFTEEWYYTEEPEKILNDCIEIIKIRTLGKKDPKLHAFINNCVDQFLDLQISYLHKNYSSDHLRRCFENTAG